MDCLPGENEKSIYFHCITSSLYAIYVAKAIIVDFTYAID
jgi:hypothetical protein